MRGDRVGATSKIDVVRKIYGRTVFKVSGNFELMQKSRLKTLKIVGSLLSLLKLVVVISVKYGIETLLVSQFGNGWKLGGCGDFGQSTAFFPKIRDMSKDVLVNHPWKRTQNIESLRNNGEIGPGLRKSLGLLGARFTAHETQTITG